MVFYHCGGGQVHGGDGGGKRCAGGKQVNAMSPETPDEFLNSFMSHSSMGSVCPKGIWNGHYLSDKEIQLLRKSMKSIKNRVDVEEDVSVELENIIQ